MYTRLLTECQQVQASDIGGKAVNLGRMASEEFPVPPGFIISSDAYDRQLQSFLASVIPDIDKSNRYLSEAQTLSIRHHFAECDFPQELEDEIFNSLYKISKKMEGPVQWVVRSSATSEDQITASHAGQHESYYYVTEFTLIEMICYCWASVWSPEACSYRRAHGIPDLEVSMAVIVQVMIPSEVSGVTFTLDPVSGDDSLIITEACWGMGAALVDGRVTPDSYSVSRTGKTIHRQKISDKRLMIPPSDSDDEASRLVSVPGYMRKKPCLNQNQIQAITYYALKAEQLFGSPQDFEWAICRDHVYALQSRPVTRIGKTGDDIPKGKYVLFKPLYENFTDPLLPLSQDLLSSQGSPVSFIYGRAYLKLGLFRALIPLKIPDAELARIGYLEPPDINKIKLSYPVLMGLIPVLIIFYLCMGVFYARTRRMPDDFMNQFRQRINRLATDPGISARDLVYHVFPGNAFLEPAGIQVLLINLSASRYWLIMLIIKLLTRRWLPDDDSVSVLTSGTSGMLSVEMGKEVLELASIAGDNPDLADFLQKTPLDEQWQKLPEFAAAGQFLARLMTFLEKHGHRGLKEMEPGSPRWSEDPTPVLNMIKNYLAHQIDPGEMAQKLEVQRQSRQAEAQRLLEKWPFEKQTGIRWALLNYLGRRAAYYSKLRENSRYFHIMIFTALRNKILELESRLITEKLLKCREDIFYLKWQEIMHLDTGTLSPENAEEVIRERRLKHVRLQKFIPPKTIGIKEASSAAPDARFEKYTDRLKGHGASPGYCQGIARVILDPVVNADLMPGEILVAPYTDPAWTPMFLTAAAAVVETGSYLSHAGTIAREYGMPCVVDVGHCTNLIHTGDLISVNGDTGEVIIVETQRDD